MTIAARLYEAHRRALEDPTSRPAWGNATTEERRAWEAAWSEAQAIYAEAERDNARPILMSAGPLKHEVRVDAYFAVPAAAGDPDLHGDVIDLAIAPEPTAAPAGSWTGVQPNAVPLIFGPTPRAELATELIADARRCLDLLGRIRAGNYSIKTKLDRKDRELFDEVNVYVDELHFTPGRVATAPRPTAARATHADVRCRVCGVKHEIGTFRDAMYREVQVTAVEDRSDHRELAVGDIGRVVDWQWRRGSTEWIRVEFHGGHRANFAPCQLRRIT